MCDGKDDLGFRMAYRGLVLSGSLTTVFRPGRAKYEVLFKSGKLVKGKIIRLPGNPEQRRNPVFTADEITLKIKSLKKILLKHLRPIDFFGSSPDVKDADSLIYHLGLIYNQPVSSFSQDTIIIRIEFEYVSIRRENYEDSPTID